MTTEATPGNKRQRRPAWWRYVLAIVVFVPGPLLIILSLVALFSACFGGTTKVIAPGESKITLPQSGTYRINYEYQTVVNGRRFDTSEVIPSALKLDLISTDSDTHIRIHEPSVHASYNVFGTKGKAMAEFTVDRLARMFSFRNIPAARQGQRLSLPYHRARKAPQSCPSSGSSGGHYCCSSVSPWLDG